MGQILSSPITTKHTTEGKDERLSFGASSMQGWRISMEDAHSHHLSYNDTGAAFFAVFDGHGGAKVAKYSSQHLPSLVIESDEFKNGDFKESLRRGFLQIDTKLRADPEYEHETSGCTAIVAMLTKDNVLYVSNAGDSRAIICTNGTAIALSQDHKPTNQKEKDRIVNAGGHVEFGRVNGNLALSRALGDFEFKNNPTLPAEKQAVSAEPDITMHKITERDEFIVLACDGIWDCMTNQEVANFVRKNAANNVSLKEICEKLMDNCLADSSNTGGVGCDNMTVEIIAFLNGKNEKQWFSRIRDSVAAISPTDIEGSINYKYGSSEDAHNDDDNAKKQGMLQSGSRYYSTKELQNVPDLTSAFFKMTTMDSQINCNDNKNSASS